jgi:hypothetical protein
MAIKAKAKSEQGGQSNANTYKDMKFKQAIHP